VIVIGFTLATLHCWFSGVKDSGLVKSPVSEVFEEAEMSQENSLLLFSAFL